MGENLLVPCAKITQLFVMNSLHMPMKIWPTPASNIAISSWAIKSKEENRIIVYLLLLILDAQDIVDLLEIGIRKVLETFRGIVRENYEFCFCLSIVSTIIDLRSNNRKTYSTMGASSRLVQCP
jgi:hypothetical protein